MCDICSFSLTQHINELTMKLDVQQVLQGAEAIYLQLTRCQVGRASVSSGPIQGGPTGAPLDGSR